MSVVSPPRTILVPLNSIGRSSEPAYLDLRTPVSEKGDDDRFFLVASGDSWGSLAFKYLGDARAWWVMADLSEIIDPFTELSPGKAIQCPSVNRFYFDLISGEDDG